LSGFKNFYQGLIKMDSVEEIQRRYIQQVIDDEKEELQKNSELISSFKDFGKSKGVNLADENFRYIQTIGTVASFPNIVSALSSGITKDKEGLVDFKMLNERFEKRPFVNGFLYSEKFMLMAHPYFRRGLHPNANFAPRFIDLFWNLNAPEITSSIAIDYDRVRINVDNNIYFEEDTWFGAKFNKKINLVSDGTVKLRPPSDLKPFMIDFFFNEAYSLDIKWETKKRIKSFQAEEFKTEKNIVNRNGKDFHPVRYVHAEYDLDKKHFRHFDGAIHFYTPDEFQARKSSDFNYNIKNSVQIKTNSVKLFKMNGNVSVDTLVEFTSNFMTQNPLVTEYFEGKYPHHISDMLDAVRKKKKA
jgi:hypothetical protein